MLVDLNVPWPQNSYADKVTSQAVNNLIKTLSTLHMLGYTHIAINFTVNHSEKFPNDVKLLNPIDIKRRFGELMDRTGLKLYSRITLIIDDPSKGQSLSKISQAFDIVAALPISEKGLYFINYQSGY
ncbi:Rpp1p [Saccharomyces cerevisiae Lalvin QA23]|nr:Rpp1p [Saccharomyces cerevisiae Lalvin QA23]